MAASADDFIRQCQTLAQQSWDTLLRQGAATLAGTSAAGPGACATPGADLFAQLLATMKASVEEAGASQPPAGDWMQSLQPLFGLFGATTGAFETGAPMPAFGLARGQQMQQQALLAAAMEVQELSARYQALIQRAHAQGMDRLQLKLVELADAGRTVDTIGALYKLWVDAVEEAYAQVALSDEFSTAYADMANAQMRLRQHQLQQVEQVCQQLGLPARSEVATLGERLQALRREFRASRIHDASRGVEAGEVAALRGEVAALRAQLAVQGAASRKAVGRKPVSAKNIPATTIPATTVLGDTGTTRSSPRPAASAKVAAKPARPAKATVSKPRASVRKRRQDS
jgi:class III poly(R)-hydroxyalkanoic acid synthase PhaE subunit